jgi:uncharacterized protein (TIGR02300 family)
MTKPELGTKRLCAHCDAKFYDLHHSPSTCPKCDSVFETTGANPRSSTKAAPAAEPKVEPVLAEIPEAQLVSLEEDDPEGEQGLGAAAELEDVVAPDDALDDAALIEESEQEDAGDDIEEENDVEDGN